MGTSVGDDITSTAGSELRALQREVYQPAARVSDNSRVHTSPSPAPPLRLALIDLLQKNVDEVVSHARAVNPDPTPVPHDRAHIYAWQAENTKHLDGERALIRDAMVHRQTLEHGIARGDDRVIRRMQCPACACWSLLWQRVERKAVCISQLCVTPAGRPHTWTLQQVAEGHAKNLLMRAAT